MTIVASRSEHPNLGLQGVRHVIRGPLLEIASRLSTFVAEALPHSALIIFTRECTGRPYKAAGERPLVDLITTAELQRIRVAMGADTRLFSDNAQLGGQMRCICALLDEPTGTLLVMVSESLTLSHPHLDSLAAVFGIVATSIQQQVVHATPAYLAEARAASSERAKAIAQMSDAQSDTLTTLLGMLRSNNLDDRRARIAATEATSRALVTLRSAETYNRDLARESVNEAFERLRHELAPLLRNRFVSIEYATPACGQESVPGEVAFAARAVARIAALACSTQPDVNRLRVAWECDGVNLVVDLRADGRGELDKDLLAQQLCDRLNALGGRIDIEVTAGWGARIAAILPLNHQPDVNQGSPILQCLNSRELDVLGHLAVGRRNRAIAEELNIGESTVKFHVGSILRKLGVRTRGEAGALALQAGITKSTSR